ncbi:hypothetical protein [Paucibacter sp. KCTC 42545]|uniref:hypothetical protein n=1 Tax=Paucibacter sp. KCTC 42545 TaxID=1768242 RepID=UPI0012E35AB2|nr:hypothetical protein [Paucibacter sp. KCTC 42545]
MLNNLGGGDDAAAQAIINKFAEEVGRCGVKLHNDHDDSEGGLRLLVRALSYGCDGRIKSSIEENKEIIERVLKRQKENSLFNELTTALKLPIGSIQEASQRLATFKAAYFSPSRPPISAERGQRFRRRRTPFQADRGQRFKLIPDTPGARK